MKIKDIKRKIKGRKTKKCSSKVYEYTFKNLSSLRFDDLVDLMGMETTFKLLDIFSGGYIYIPKKSTIKKDFIHAIIRTEAIELIKEIKVVSKVVTLLANKYNLHEEHIYKLLGLKNNDALDKDIFIRKAEIDNIKDENLLYLLKNNWDLLKEHNLI